MSFHFLKKSDGIILVRLICFSFLFSRFWFFAISIFAFSSFSIFVSSHFQVFERKQLRMARWMELIFNILLLLCVPQPCDVSEEQTRCNHFTQRVSSSSTCDSESVWTFRGTADVVALLVAYIHIELNTSVIPITKKIVGQVPKRGMEAIVAITVAIATEKFFTYKSSTTCQTHSYTVRYSQYCLHTSSLKQLKCQ